MESARFFVLHYRRRKAEGEGEGAEEISGKAGGRAGFGVVF